jgi:hypothetical protein
MDANFILKAVGLLLAAGLGGFLLNSKFKLDSLLTNKKTNDKVDELGKESFKNEAKLEIEEAKRKELSEQKPKDLSVSQLLDWLNKK